MSAYVIDGKKKRQYIALFVVSIIVSFALGFTSGYFTNLSPESPSFDQLKSRIDLESEIPNEDQPQEGTVDTDKAAGDKATGDEKQSDDKVPEGETPAKKAEAGAVNSRVDTKVSSGSSSAPVENSKVVAQKTPPRPVTKPQVAIKTVTAAKPPPRPQPKPQPKPQPEPEPKPEPVPASMVEKPQTPVSREAAGNLSKPADTPAAPTAPPAPMTPPPAPMTPPAAATEEKLPVAYTPEQDEVTETADKEQKKTTAFAVQVGLFVNKDNAQKLVYELLDKGFDAYMDEFQASDGEIKYNVRFGRYPDRASVQSKLAEYKRAYASPAYIIITK